MDRTRVKARVKITGEFWLQTHEGDGNYNIKQWLEQEDSEVMPPPVAVWLHYLMHPVIRKLEHRHSTSKHPKRDDLLLHGLERIYVGTYNRFRKALANIPNELPDQEELKDLAEPFYHFELRGGEGHMLIGKALLLLPPQESAHDLRAFAVLLHAEHDVDWFDGQRDREVSRPALRADRSQGRCRGARSVPLPDDSDRGQEACSGRIRGRAEEDRLDRRSGPTNSRNITPN